MTEAGDILGEVNRHLKETGTPPSRFGRDCVGDPGLVFDLRAGRALRTKTAQRIRDFIAKTEPPKPPYPFCLTPDKCAGKGYCPREIACND